jgi:hypothetical protein
MVSVRAAADDPLIARVNGTEIRQSDLAIAEEEFGQNRLPADAKVRRDFLVTYLSDLIVVANAAKKTKIADDADLQRRIAFTRNKLLMEMQLRNVGVAAVSEQSLHKAYEEATKQGGEIEMHLRGMLFRFDNPADEAAVKAAEDRAKAALDRVKNGEDFAVVAKDVTDAPAGKQNSGDLGYLSKAQMGLEFSEVAMKLGDGQISQPIKTAFGWHVIKVEDRRQRKIPDFDEVRKQVEAVVMRKAQLELVNKLRANAKIERLDQSPQSQSKQ